MLKAGTGCDMPVPMLNVQCPSSQTGSPPGGAVPTCVLRLQGRQEERQPRCGDMELRAARGTGNPGLVEPRGEGSQA